MGVPSLNDLAVDGTLNTTNQPDEKQVTNRHNMWETETPSKADFLLIILVVYWRLLYSVCVTGALCMTYLPGYTQTTSMNRGSYTFMVIETGRGNRENVFPPLTMVDVKE